MSPGRDQMTPDIGASGVPTPPRPGVGPVPVATGADTYADDPLEPPAGGRHRDPEGLSLGELFAEVSRDVTTLLRQEVDLAKAEAMTSVKRAGRGSGMLAGAAWAAGMVLVFLSVAIWWALGTQTGWGWSGLVVAGIWLVVAAVLAVVGRSELRRTPGLPQTTASLAKIPDALRGNDGTSNDDTSKETNR